MLLESCHLSHSSSFSVSWGVVSWKFCNFTFGRNGSCKARGISEFRGKVDGLYDSWGTLRSLIEQAMWSSVTKGFLLLQRWAILNNYESQINEAFSGLLFIYFPNGRWGWRNRRAAVGVWNDKLSVEWWLCVAQCDLGL